MLSSLRCTASRTLRSTRRGLSTTTDAGTSDGILKEGFEKINQMLGVEGKHSLSSPLPPSTPARQSLLPASSLDMNIPPAEDPLLKFLTGFIQQNGHRHRAAKITSRMLLHIHTLTRAPPLPIFRKAVMTIAPAVRCISNKHANKTVVYPVALSEQQRTRFAFKWIIEASKSRPGPVEERLAKEVIAIVQGIGEKEKDQLNFSQAFKMKKDVHNFAVMHRGSVQRNAGY